MTAAAVTAAAVTGAAVTAAAVTAAAVTAAAVMAAVPDMVRSAGMPCSEHPCGTWGRLRRALCRTKSRPTYFELLALVQTAPLHFRLCSLTLHLSDR